MRKRKKLYHPAQLVSACFMILALLWLTVSTPFVYASQLKQDNGNLTNCSSPLAGTEEESSKPLGNTTEEKIPGSTSVSEEYLHDHHNDHYFDSILLRFHKSEDADTYIAFHGELLVPPPNA